MQDPECSVETFYFCSTSEFSALLVSYENALYQFTFYIDIGIAHMHYKPGINLLITNGDIWRSVLNHIGCIKPDLVNRSAENVCFVCCI